MRRWSQLGLMALGTMLALSAFGAPETAEAQPSAELAMPDGMDLHLFRPAVDSKGHLSVNGTDILGHLDFSFGLVLDFGHEKEEDCLSTVLRRKAKPDLGVSSHKTRSPGGGAC